MPQTSKGPRLWKRPPVRKGGKIIRSALWVIRDGSTTISTGCTSCQADTKPPAEAEQALANYVVSKYNPARKAKDIENIDVADVLDIYRTDKSYAGNEFDDMDGRILRLTEFWGGKVLSDINPATCREYVEHRGSSGGARRDLECLRAAINHHGRSNLHYGKVSVTLPPKGEPRDRWLTRSEAASLIWTCYHYREHQTVHIGKNRGQKIETDRRPLRHIARFVLIGTYTGTRASSIAAASPYQKEGRSYVDLERGLFYRKQIGRRATNKRQTPAPVPPGLLAHMRRWFIRGLLNECFVEYNGKPVQSVKKGFAKAVGLAKIEGKVTPHTLRHTAATWLMQQGVPIWVAAGYLGMSPEVLEKNYGHHHPDFMKQAVEAISKKSGGKRITSLRQSL